ncbi:hypothetical protein RHMOL_Rhmol04G0070400 [Rhododendron molle]|uniref:Uncharacterized protein n=1 Tax=Rhododendron molle TaxID=49168 RepID=A0ACC0P0C5_RHOML|nr:hypothetical protein RHMOL_Rhmol04G0070400 [Rhododendron molle]
MTVFFFRVLLVCSLLVTSTGANQIGYGTMPPFNWIPKYKTPAQANPHSRGCEKNTKMTYRKSLKVKQVFLESML